MPISAHHAVSQATRRIEQITAAGASTDVEEALLRHLGDLKQLVSGAVDQARDVEALRTLIRTLFEHIILRRWSWDDLDEIEAAGVAAGDGMFLIPVLREGVADWSSLPPKINRVPLPGDVTPSTVDEVDARLEGGVGAGAGLFERHAAGEAEPRPEGISETSRSEEPSLR